MMMDNQLNMCLSYNVVAKKMNEILGNINMEILSNGNCLQFKKGGGSQRASRMIKGWENCLTVRDLKSTVYLTDEREG